MQRDADGICEISDTDDDQGEPLPLGEFSHIFADLILHTSMLSHPSEIRVRRNARPDALDLLL